MLKFKKILKTILAPILRISIVNRWYAAYILANSEDWIISARRKYSNNMLAKKQRNAELLSPKDIKDIQSLWNTYSKKYAKLTNLAFYAVYKKYKDISDNLADYFPDDFFYCYVDKYFTNYHTSIKLDNKNMYDLYFHDVVRPHTIARKMDGILLDRDYNITSLDKVINSCIESKDVIIKKSIDSDGGHGVSIVTDCANNTNLLEQLFGNNDDLIIQDLIKQHPTLASFNPQSVNTIGIMTLNLETPVVLSSVFRMGVNGSNVDNASSGGIVCGITRDGMLKSVAYDSFANQYTSHPQGFSFEGVKVPAYDQCEKIAINLSNRFVNYSRLISWDFAIDKNGTPLLIEANLTGGQLDFHQLCNGPIFKPYISLMLTEIFEKSPDIKNSLFVIKS